MLIQRIQEAQFDLKGHRLLECFEHWAGAILLKEFMTAVDNCNISLEDGGRRPMAK